MKQIGKDKMQEIAKEVFERFPKAQKVAVVSDGQAFIIDNGDAAAKNHAKNNIYGKELSVATFLRDDVQEKKQTPKADKKTAAELIAEVEKAETVEAVKAILGKDKRATVIAASEKRITEIQKAKEAEKVADLIAQIGEAETEDAVNAILGDDKREAVVNAATERINALKNQV